ncbi:MAG TPA: hypothetical protein VJ852_09270 [Gemmatimonadaceae bacterium]|nr:hypothetical protein [Gemmatimonadaceae bacterium]
MKFLSTLLLFVFATAALRAQDTSKVEPLDGANRPLQDSLLEQLVGHWQVNRVIRGASAGSTVDASWVLNHQFVQFHYLPDRASKQPYEAIVYIGYDNMSDRYVVHWLDIFGGRVSETMGFGSRTPDGMRFVFEYPDGPFTNTFTFDPASRGWNLLLRQKNARGQWTTFATEQWRRAQQRDMTSP